MPDLRKYQAVTNGTCKNPSCGKPYRKGDWIIRVALGRFVHVGCH